MIRAHQGLCCLTGLPTYHHKSTGQFLLQLLDCRFTLPVFRSALHYVSYLVELPVITRTDSYFKTRSQALIEFWHVVNSHCCVRFFDECSTSVSFRHAWLPKTEVKCIKGL